MVFAFGTDSIQVDESVLIFANPGFQLMKQAVDVSEIYIDTFTCKPLQLERFITYLLNYPPKKGISFVKIFHKGALDNLGKNLKNSLQNNFQHVKEML